MSSALLSSAMSRLVVLASKKLVSGKERELRLLSLVLVPLLRLALFGESPVSSSRLVFLITGVSSYLCVPIPGPVLVPNPPPRKEDRGEGMELMGATRSRKDDLGDASIIDGLE